MRLSAIFKLFILISLLMVSAYPQTAVTSEFLISRITRASSWYSGSASGSIRSINFESFNPGDKSVGNEYGRLQYREDIDFLNDGSGLEITIYPGGKSPFRRVRYTFDADRKLIRNELFELTGAPTGTRSDYFYNSSGILTKIEYLLLGSRSFVEFISFPGNRKVGLKREFDSPELDDRETISFDKLGRITEVILQEGDNKRILRYKYDKYGNPIELAEFDGKGRLLRGEKYDLVLDGKKNWIKMIGYEFSEHKRSMAPQPIDIQTRIITYR